MINKLNYKVVLAIVALIAVLGVFSVLLQRPWQAYGSVPLGQEYYATTTDTQATFANYSVIQGPAGKANMSPVGTRVATSGPTVLGSVIITIAGTSPFCLYDATSTRTNAEWATTTIACFGASAAVGQYGPWDVQYQKGILFEFTGSATATSRASTTVTYR